MPGGGKDLHQAGQHAPGNGAPGKQLWECLATVLQMLSAPKENHSKGGSHLWADGGSREVALCHAQPWSWALVAAGATDKPLLLQRSWPGTSPRPVGIIHRAMAEGQAGHLVLEMNKQTNNKLGSS